MHLGLTKEVIYADAKKKKKTQQDQPEAHAFRAEAKYNKLNKDLRNGHLALLHTSPVTQGDKDEAEPAVKKYMTTYRHFQRILLLGIREMRSYVIKKWCIRL